jgi:hypothetical protein
MSRDSTLQKNRGRFFCFQVSTDADVFCIEDKNSQLKAFNRPNRLGCTYNRLKIAFREIF